MPTTPSSRRTTIETPTAIVPETIIKETGEPVRPWRVFAPDGSFEVVEFSLALIPIADRPVYWNPIYPEQKMLWRAQEKNDWGVQPVIQREAWIDGKYAPRNLWEVHMTREFIKTLPGGEPDKWVGYNHPENEPGQLPHHWRCECSFICGNWKAFKAHQLYLRHRELISE